jgi:predicted TIM-barrel fold metal-dependent hydrolase
MFTSSRRQFLAALASVPLLEAQTRSREPGLIDVHHHIMPEFWEQAVSRPQKWSVEQTLDEMDRNHVSAAVLSYTTPGVWTGDVQSSRHLARRSNEYAAQVRHDHPGRFGFFAALPLPDPEGSLAEAAYALDTLKADGIGLITSYGDRWPGDPAFSPVFEELNRRKAVVYFHPTAPNCCRGNLVPGVAQRISEYPQDTTRAVTSLLYSGSLLKYRDISFIFSHGGGTLPMLAGRIQQLDGALLAKQAPQGVDFELARLYYEIANATHPAAMAALTKLAPISHILFGTDYPFVPVGATAEGMRHVGLSRADLQSIGRENALRLLPGVKAA